jgi:hypothetical protein
MPDEVMTTRKKIRESVVNITPIKTKIYPEKIC